MAAIDKDSEIKVFISHRESQCGECHAELHRKSWITLDEKKGALCLSCGDLDHLIFLPPGDAALTRRSRKHSPISAVVLEWSRSRKRYERQGVLVTEEALKRAEEECLSDADVRERRRQREAIKRESLDLEYVDRFAAKVRSMYPKCPTGREKHIAEHACKKYSGRVGRSQAAQSLDEQAVRLAVIAHIRHAETNYDDLLGRGYDRFDARDAVANQIDTVIAFWESTE
jgi:hypothetical protein